jgi:AraC family L-rhamnose operon regulatory protein RhaS
MVKKYRIADYEEGLSFPFNIRRDHIEDRFPEHTHDHTEIVLILKGSGRHIVNGRPYFVQPGDVFVFGPHTRHGFRNASGLDVVNIMFRPAVLAGLRSDIQRSPGFQTLFVITPGLREDFPCRLRLKPDALTFASVFTSGIIDEFESKSEGYRSLCQARFSEFVVFLVRQFSRTATLRLAETAAWMEKNYLSPVKLDDIVRLSGFSSRHFIRLFKAHYRSTPIRYIVDLKIRHSQALLSDTERKITQIAFDSGFLDSNYYTRQFHRSLGCTPEEYRRRIRH